MSWTPALGKGRRPHRVSLGASALCAPLPRPGAAARPPEARRGGPASQPLCGTPPSAQSLRSRRPGGRRGAGGGRGPGEGSYLSAASVPRSWVCRWDCGAGEAPTDSNRATPRPSPLRWPRASAPGPGDRRRASGRRQLRWGAVGRGRLPGPAWRGLGSDYLEEQRRSEKAPRPPRRDLALNLNLYLTLCPEGGEETHLSWDGLSRPPPLPGRGRARPPRGRKPGSPRALGAPQTASGSSVLRSPRPLKVGVRTRPPRLRPGGVGRGPAPALPPRTRPAAGAAHGRPDSLHVASAAAIQPLIEH